MASKNTQKFGRRNERTGFSPLTYVFPRNYKMALEQMLSDAHSLRNTAIYVLLSILLAVTVNPLAAYALSRFKRSTRSCPSSGSRFQAGEID